MEQHGDAAAGPEGSAGPRWGGGRRASRHRRGRVLRGVVWTSVGLVLSAAAGFAFVYVKLNGNIAGIDINRVLGTERPKNVPNGSLDILVLGSDSRAGRNARYGQTAGEPRADTAMVVHVHRGQRRASIVSIPRDTLIDRPRCQRATGRAVPAARRVMFNAAYAVGGPTCAVKTVEAMTGIRMDHYLEVDFTGFKRLIDRLGGVKITTVEAIEDEDAHLDLPAGRHVLDGEQSLGLVRTRKGVGDGSDLGRIELQQTFVKALVGQIRDVDVLNDPRRLYALADTATSGVTTDSALASVGKLVGLGKTLQGIDADSLHMVTLPVGYDATEPNRVVPLVPQAERVWKALRHDRTIPRSALEDSVGRTAESGGSVG